MRNSFSRPKKDIKHLFTESKRNMDRPGVGEHGERVDASGSLPRPETGVVTGGGREQEGNGSNADNETVEPNAAVWKSPQTRRGYDAATRASRGIRSTIPPTRPRLVVGVGCRRVAGKRHCRSSDFDFSRRGKGREQARDPVPMDLAERFIALQRRTAARVLYKSSKPSPRTVCTTAHQQRSPSPVSTSFFSMISPAKIGHLWPFHFCEVRT